MARSSLLALAGVAAVAAAVAASPQSATFKSSTELVEVDAVILDARGNFVPGLSADQVTLYENGKPQHIQHFFMVTHDLDLSPGAASQPGTQAQYGAQRVFVMLFDEPHLANDSMMRVKAGAETFVREMFSKGDAGGVFVNGGMYRGRLTDNKEELLSGIRAVQPAFENRQGILAPFQEWPRIPSEVDASRIADGAREVTTSLAVVACREDPAGCQNAGGVGQLENVIERKARLYVRQARFMTDRTIRSLDRIAQGLARIPGRKTVVLMSEGFYVQDARGTLEALSARAARSGITICAIDGRGLINGLGANPDVIHPELPRTANFDTGEDGPNMLAQSTGGFAVRSIDDMSRAFGLVVRDTSTYYVIGYQPQNASMDGKVRKIEVRTNVPGARVRARKSYAAVKLPPQESIWGPGGN
jgi:VWFA-related protein